MGQVMSKHSERHQPVSWHAPPEFWRRCRHRRSGLSTNAVFTALVMGIQRRLVKMGKLSCYSPLLLEETLEFVGFYEGHQGNMRLEDGSRYKVCMQSD